MDKILKESIVNVLKFDARLKARGIEHKNIITSEPSRESDLLWVIQENSVTKYIFIEFKSKSKITIEDFRGIETSLCGISVKEKSAMLLFDGEIAESAAAYAKNKNIIISKVLPPTDVDWEGRIKDINVNMNIMVPKVRNLKVNFNFEQAKGLLAQTDKDSFRFSFSGTADQLILSNQSAGYSKTLDELFKEYTESQSIKGEPKHVHHDFTEIVYVETEIGQVEISSLDFDIDWETIQHPILVDGSKNIGFAIGFTIVKNVLSLPEVPNYKP